MIELETLTTDQRTALRDLLDAAEQADGTRPTNESADLVIDGRRPGSHVVVTEGHSILGLAVMDERDATIQLVVHPRHRRMGHGTALLQAALAKHSEYTVWAFGTLTGAVGLARALHLTPTRELLKMTRPLGEEPAPTIQEGWRIRPHTAADDEGVVAVNAAAFSHHPEQGKLTLAEFRDLTTQPWFSSDGLLVATPDRDGAGVVGFHWTKRHDERVGEVYVLAVEPGQSGHGLGRSLLEAGLAHLAAIGCSEVILFVEASEERVVAMYRSASFVTATTDTSYRS